MKSNEFEKSLHNFFDDLFRYLMESKFIDDFTTISLEASELQEKFIYTSFLHVGENVSQKISDQD